MDASIPTDIKIFNSAKNIRLYIEWKGRNANETETSSSSIEFESWWAVEWETSGCHPLAIVRGQLTFLQASIVEKPAACLVVGFRAQLTTHRPCGFAHFDYSETSRNHSNVFIQHVLVTSICRICHNTSVMLVLSSLFLLLRQNIR